MNQISCAFSLDMVQKSIGKYHTLFIRLFKPSRPAIVRIIDCFDLCSRSKRAKQGDFGLTWWWGAMLDCLQAGQRFALFSMKVERCGQHHPGGDGRWQMADGGLRDVKRKITHLD